MNRFLYWGVGIQPVELRDLRAVTRVRWTSHHGRSPVHGDHVQDLTSVSEEMNSHLTESCSELVVWYSQPVNNNVAI